MTDGDSIQFSTECCAAPGTVDLVLQVSDALPTWKRIRVGDEMRDLAGRGEYFPNTPDQRTDPITLNVAELAGRWLDFAKSKPVIGLRYMYNVDLTEMAPYAGLRAVFRWFRDDGGPPPVPDWRFANFDGTPLDDTLLEEANGSGWAVYGGVGYPGANRATFTRLFPNYRIYKVANGEPARWLKSTPADGTLLREESGKISVVYGGAQFHVPDPPTLDRLFGGQAAQQLWDGALARIPTVPMDSTMLREDNGKIWVVFGGAKFHVPDPGTLIRLYSGRPIFQLWDGALAGIPDAPADGTLLREESGAIWVVFGQSPFWVPDPPTLVRLYGGRPVHQLWNGTLGGLPRIPVDGTYLREESDTMPYLMVNGHKVRPTGILADLVRVVWNGALAHIP